MRTYLQLTFLIICFVFSSKFVFAQNQQISNGAVLTHQDSLNNLLQQLGRTPNPNQTLAFTLSTSKKDVKCGGTCDGEVYISITGGTGPFTINYTPSPPSPVISHTVTLTPGTTRDTLKLLCADTYTIEVIDIFDGSSLNDFQSITAPPTILINFTNTPVSTNCFNSCDGVVATNVFFAVGSKTYLWSPGGQTVEDPTNMCAGVCTLTVTDGNGCVQTKSLTITSPSQLSAGLTPVQPVCLSTVGSASVNPTGGTSPYMVKWSTGGGFISSTTNSSITNIPTGNYWVVVKDAKGCRDSVAFTITPPPSPTITLSTPTMVTCFGACNGSDVGSATGGTLPYASTIWTGPGSSVNTLATGNVLCAGTWTLTVTDANGCFDTAMVVITEPPAFTVNAGSDTSICFNGTKTLTATPSPASAGITYQWSPLTGITGAGNTQSVSVTLTSSVTYIVTATNAAGCSDTSDVVVTVNPLPTIVATPSAPQVCIGSCVSITASGASTYTWAPNGAGSPAFMTPASGVGSVVSVCPPNNFTYTITGTDVNGCVNTTTVTAVVKALPTITTSGNVTICPGGSTTITATGSPAGTFSYSWAGPNVVSGGNTATVTVNPSSTATYTVTGTDALGCSSTATATVTVAALPTIGAGLDQTICFGASTTLTGSSNQIPTSYSWAGAGIVGSSTTQTVTVSPASTTTYTVTGTNTTTGCSKTDNVIVTVLAQLPVNAGNDTTICKSTVIQLLATGAASYSWTELGGGFTSIVGGAAGATVANPFVNPTVTTSYIVTGTSGSCQQKDTVTITVNSLPNVSAGSDVALCIGNSTSLTATGALTYTWSPNGAGTPAFMNPSNGVGASVNVAPTATQTYVVTGTDANGCTKTDNVIVTVNPLPIVSAGSDKSICLGGSATLNASGATTYSWSPSTGLSSTTVSNPTTTAAVTTAYTVTGTDNNGCQNTDIVNVTVHSVTATATVDTTIFCSGGTSVQLGSNGGGVGGTYQWAPATPVANISNPNIQNPTASPTATTTYIVTVTDINNCFSTASVTVTFDQVVAAIADTTSPTACGNNDGAIDLNITSGFPGYTYSWTGGAGTSQDPSGLLAGVYTVSITDSKGCTGTATAVLDDPSSMTLTSVVTLPSTCGGSNGCIDLTVTNFVGVLGYTWSSGPTTEDICGLSAGTFNVTVSDGSNCNKSLSVPVVNPTAVPANAGNDTSLCAGGTVTLNAGAGFASYSWSPGTSLNPDSVSQTVTIVPVATTTYILTTVDANSCPSTDFVTVTVNALPVADAGSNTSICPGTTFNFNASGGGTYAWTADPSFTGSTTIANPIANPTVTTTYFVTVTDVNSCVDSDSIIVTLSPLVLSQTHNDVTVCGLCDGDINLTVTGGNIPYTYAWSNGAVTQDLSALCLGGYNVTVNDALGCNDTMSVSIQSPTTLTVSGVVTNIATCGVNNGAVDVTVVGGTGALTYVWTDFSGAVIGSAEDISGLSAGTYTIVVTDALGCGQTQIFVITQPTAPTISAGSDVTICAGGTVNLSVTTTGVGNTFDWSGCGFVATPTLQNQTVTPAATTTYCVTVTSPQSCVSTDSVTVNVTGMTLTPIVTNVSTCGASDGSILINVSNGTAPFVYNFGPSPVQSGAIPAYNGLAIGSYNVVVTDGLGCVDSLTNILINDPSNVAVSGVVTDNTTCGAANGAIVITPTGGNGAFSFAWTGSGVIVANQNQSSLAAGTYSVTVTDALSCGTTASFTVNDPTPVKPIAGPDNSLCNGTSVQLVADTASITSFSWNNPGTLNNSTINNPIANPNATTVYILTTIDNKNCQSSDTLTLNVLPSPNVDAGSNLNLCSGGSNQIVASGATTYSWSPALGLSQTNISNPTATPSVTTTYYLTGTSLNGCSSTDSVIVFSSGLSLSQTVTSPTVCGLDNGSIDLTVGLGVTPYTYQWSTNVGSVFNQQQEDVDSLTAGVYVVHVTDALGCNDSLTATISDPGTLAASVATTPTSTCGGVDGTATVTPILGSAPYTQIWNPGGATTTSITGAAGTYFVSVTDNIGCTVVVSGTINNPAPAPITLGPDIITCVGDTLNLSVTSGISYSWSPSAYLNFTNLQSPQSIPLSDVTYIVDVTDNNNCVAHDTLVIDVKDLLLSEFHTNVSTCGGIDGAINLTVSGGSGSYLYSWIKNQTTNVGSGQDLTGNLVTPIGFGNYTVYVTDQISGCFDSLSVTISEPTPFTVTETHTDPTTCNGSDGTITLTIVGGAAPFTFNWNHGAIGPNPTGLSQGTYTLTMSDASGCSFVMNVTLTDPIPTNYTAGNDVTICYGSSVTLNATPSVGSFVWIPSSSLVGANTASPIATPSDTVTYTLTATDANNCTSSDQVVVNVIRLFTNGVVTNASSCVAPNGQVVVNPTGATAPYTYAWDNASTNDSIINLATGNYIVTVTESSAFACQEVDTFTVNSNTPLQVFAGNDTTLCSGVTSLDIIATSNPSAGTVYSWTQSPSPVVLDNDSAFTANVVSGTTVFYVNAINGACNAVDSIAITIGGIPIKPNAGPDASLCNGTTLHLNADTANILTFSWNNVGTLDTATIHDPIASPNTTTVYILTTSDINHCQSSDTLTLTVLNSPTVDAGPNVNLCSGSGSNQLSGTGATSYLWSPSLGLSQTNIPNPTVNPSSTTTYYLTAFDASGCSATDSAIVYSGGLSLATIASSPTTCGTSTGSIDLTVNAGISPYTYLWSANAGSATTQDVSLLAVGVYTVTVTDSIGCSDSLITTVSDNTTLTASIVSTLTTTCGGNDGTLTATPSLGTAPYTQVWTPGGATTLSITGAAGIYFITVTDNVGCAAVFSDTINDPTALPINVGPDITTCTGDTLNLSVAAGASYLWTPSAFLNFNNLQTPQAVPLSDVTYVVSVTDFKNCVAVDTLVIDIKNLILSELHTNTTTCNGTDGAINLSVAGGSGSYSYQWVKNNTTNIDTTEDLIGNAATPIGFGNYTVYVADLISGCFDSLTVSISGPTPYSVSETHVNPTTCNGVDGSITLTVTGGTAPFTYNWTNGASGQNPTGLAQGQYDLIMTDSTLCPASVSVILNGPTPQNYTAGNDVTICYGVPLTLNALPNTATSFVWTPSATLVGANTASPVATPADTIVYTLTVTDVNNCTITDSVKVSVIRIFTNGVVTNATSCVNTDGSVVLHAAGGVTPYSYTWSANAGGSTIDSIINVVTGDYYATVTESSPFACVEVDTFTVNSLVPLQVFAGNDTTLCNGTTSLTIIATSNPSQGTVYTWTQSAVVIDNDSMLVASPSSGTVIYQVDVTNGSCTATDQISVTIGSAVNADAGVDTSMYIGESLTIGGNPSGPVGSVFEWTPSATLSSSSIANPSTSTEETVTYVLTVTTSLGCVGVDSVVVTIKPEVKFANGLSPNGDGKNDVWIIDLISKYPEATVQVFNRWGQNVFSSAPGYPDPWDGTFNGKPLPVGTYYYIIDLKDDKYKPYTGPITIFR